MQARAVRPNLFKDCSGRCWFVGNGNWWWWRVVGLVAAGASRPGRMQRLAFGADPFGADPEDVPGGLNMQTHFLHFGPFCIFCCVLAFFLKGDFSLVGCIFCIFGLFPGINSCILCLEKKRCNRHLGGRRNFLNYFERPFFVLDPLFPL